MSAMIGTPVNRVEGEVKVTGQARYCAEIPLEHMSYALLVGSTIASGHIRHIDTTQAQKADGVLAVLTHLNIPKIVQAPKLGISGFGGPAPGQSFFPLQTSEIFYAGQPIAVIVAETLEQAEYAATLIKVRYQEKPALTSLAQALQLAYHPDNVAGRCGPRGEKAPPPAEVYQPQAIFAGVMPASMAWGDAPTALKEAPVYLAATYTCAMNHHNPIEPSATTAFWERNQLTLYDATQGITATQQTVAFLLGLSPSQVRVVTQFVGGSFGSKAMIWPHQTLAAIAARVVDRPVKLALTRSQMFTSCGHREEQMQEIALGATRDGKLTAFIHHKVSGTSFFDDWAEPSLDTPSMMYACPNYEGSYRLVRLNTMTPTFMRGPGEASGMFAFECALDELAVMLELDPIELRLHNYADTDPKTGKPWSSKSLKACYARGAELIGWNKRSRKPRSMRSGNSLVGYGMASAAYPIYVPAQPQKARARLFADGHAIIQSGTQDFGNGARTAMTQIAAEALGLPLSLVRFDLGDTDYPFTVASVGSMGSGATGSAVLTAGRALRDKLITMAVNDQRSPLYQASGPEIIVEEGRMFVKGNPILGETYRDLLTRQMLSDVEVIEQWMPPVVDPETSLITAPDGKQYAMHSFGAQFAEVHVDPDLGLIRMQRLVGVFAAGRILNPILARSQLMGGMIWGLSQALLEATHVDERSGRFTNGDMAGYLMPVHADVKEVIVECVEEHDPIINPLGVKGVGELGQIGMAAAVANAVYHATGKRIRHLPILLEDLL